MKRVHATGGILAFVLLGASGSFGAACSSSSQPTDLPQVRGVYEPTSASPVSKLTFYDASHYFLWRTPCRDGSGPTCFESGTYSLNEARTSITMTDYATGLTSTMPFQVTSVQTLSSQSYSGHLGIQGLTGDSGDLSGDSGPLTGDGGPLLGEGGLTSDGGGGGGGGDGGDGTSTGLGFDRWVSAFSAGGSVIGGVGTVMQGYGAINPPAPKCVPGMANPCVGPGGCPGGQYCASDGKSFGACTCATTPEPDAGAPSDAGAGPDAGDAGSDATDGASGG